MHISNTIKEILHKLVDEQGSQLAFSKSVSISQATIARYLSGDIRSLSGDALFKLKKILLKKLKEKYATTLRSSREKHHKSREGFAITVGLTEKEVGDIETERALPTPYQWEKISKALNISLEPPPLDFFDDSDIKKGLPKLHEIRTKIDVTQTELSALTGISQKAISAYESSAREPSKENIEKLAMALSVTPYELIKGLSHSTPRRNPLHGLDPKALEFFPEDIRELVINYDRSKPEGKKELLEMSRDMARRFN